MTRKRKSQFSRGALEAMGNRMGMKDLHLYTYPELRAMVKKAYHDNKKRGKL